MFVFLSLTRLRDGDEVLRSWICLRPLALVVLLGAHVGTVEGETGGKAADGKGECL